MSINCIEGIVSNMLKLRIEVDNVATVVEFVEMRLEVSQARS